MITLVVPTRNRAHTLRLVASSYFQQDLVDELIFVDDHGNDDTHAVLSALTKQHPSKRVVILRNDCRKGAPYSRIRGYQSATNAYVLFCDDDEYLEPNYASICLAKIQESGAAIVSGRRVYKTPGETPEQAVLRFGHGTKRAAPFNKYVCQYIPSAFYTGDIKLPLTNSVILTRKDLLEKFSFDTFYSSGNGYREESDYQMNAFVNGLDILVTNDVHSIHLSQRECSSGGQRINRFKRLYWGIYYTSYFYKKYYTGYARRIGLEMSQTQAIIAFSIYHFYELFLRNFNRIIPFSDKFAKLSR